MRQGYFPKCKGGGFIASPVVFKLRVHNSNFKKQAEKNRAHIIYIAKRLGVSFNNGVAHGLFGKMDGMDFGDIKDLKAAADYVHKKSSEKTHCYRGVISLKENDALRLGIENKEDWQGLIHEHIYDVAEQAGIKPSNLEFAAAVHMEAGHPHVHFMFWEKEQGVKKAWIAPKVSNDIRISLIKKIFKDELAELHALKNESRNVLIGDTDNFFKAFFEPYKNMTESEYKKAVAAIKENPKSAFVGLTNFNIPDAELESFATRIFEFRNKLPTSGRINYKLLPPELKEELKDIIYDLVDYNEDFKREYDKYIETSVKLAEYFIKESDGTEQGDVAEATAYEKARQNAEDDIIKRLSNKLLTNIKGIDRSNENYKSKNYRKSETLKILSDLFVSLFQENERHRGAKIGDNKRELSKQAKKELAIKMENASSIDWEEEFER